MEPFSFTYLEKNEFDCYAPRLFALLHRNMTPIAPTGNSYEEDYAAWCRAYGGAFRGREERKIVLILSPEEEFVGFFAYCALGDTFHMEEIQFAPAYQGKYGMFRALYRFVLERLPPDLKFVEAYVHKTNEKSLAVQRHLGLRIIGESKNGNCFHLQGDFADLLRWNQNHA